MPTYYCIAPAGFLDQSKKAAIAKEITRIHNSVTGAASFFAQVIFREIEKGNHFMGGNLLSGDQIFVHGFIRSGRSVPDRQRVVTELSASLSKLSGLPKRRGRPKTWAFTASTCPSTPTSRCGGRPPIRRPAVPNCPMTGTCARWTRGWR